MEMKIKSTGETQYVINNMVIIADNFKAAIAEYISIHGSGGKVIFGGK